MAQSSKGATERERKMALVNIYGQMVLAMRVSGKIMKSQDMDSISGQTAENI